MDSPKTTPSASPKTQIAQQSSASPNTKIAALQQQHDALQSTVELLTKQMTALNLEPTRVEAEKHVETPAEKPDGKKAKATPAFALPWTGVPISGCCQGIRSNYDTFTQCHQACVKDGDYCKTCTKNCGELGIPKEGNVDTRSEITKKVKGYIHYMNAKKLSKQDVIEEAAKFDITLADEIFEKPTSGAKGRPKKSTAVIDSDEDAQLPQIQILGLLDTEPTSPKSP
jgi:TolA-binding protein